MIGNARGASSFRDCKSLLAVRLLRGAFGTLLSAELPRGVVQIEMSNMHSIRRELSYLLIKWLWRVGSTMRTRVGKLCT